MSALQITAFGEPLVLQLRPSSPPSTVLAMSEVLVQVDFAGVNPIDAKTRAGLGGAAKAHQDDLPWTPGYDVCGHVLAVGEQVHALEVGDKVCGLVGFPLEGGGYGQWLVAKEALWVKCHGIDSLAAAGLPLAGLTAWQGLFEHGALQAGERVLILAAAGGVGHLAVQCAHAAGAYVIATASPVNHQWLKQLGADEVLDYHQPEQLKAQLLKSGLVDLVLDLVGGESGMAALAYLAPHGRMVTVPTLTAAAISQAGEAASKRVQGMLVQANREQLQNLVAQVATGQLQVVVSEVFALAEGRHAHCLIEQGHVRGKLILKMPALDGAC